MSRITIYHNPRCSKSRKTLSLLEDNGVAPEIIRYLETTLTAAQISTLLQKLGMTPGQLVRRGEAAFKECGLNASSAESEILAAMAANPKLIERPIVVMGDKAVLGRPPENVLELIG